MHSARRPFLVFVAALLPGLLFATAVAFGVLGVIGSPEPIKDTLRSSGIYNSVTSEVLKQAEKSSGSTSEIALSHPEVKKAAESVFSPQVVQDSTEEAIDGIYNWLDGDTPLPDFSVNLVNFKAEFAKKIGDVAEDRAAKLPRCKSSVAPSSFDPLSAKCLPRGVTPAQVGAQAEQDIQRGEGFLENPTLTADSIKEDGSTKSIFADQLKNAPENYQRLKNLPIWLSILTLLTAAAVIFLSPTKRQGIKRAGITLIFAGAALLIFAWALNYTVNNKLVPNIDFENKVLQSNVRKLVGDASQKIDNNYWIFGGTYLALGALAVSGAVFMGRKNESIAPSKADHLTEQTDHKTPEKKPKTPSKT